MARQIKEYTRDDWRRDIAMSKEEIRRIEGYVGEFLDDNELRNFRSLVFELSCQEAETYRAPRSSLEFEALCVSRRVNLLNHFVVPIVRLHSQIDGSGDNLHLEDLENSVSAVYFNRS